MIEDIIYEEDGWDCSRCVFAEMADDVEPRRCRRRAPSAFHWKEDYRKGSGEYEYEAVWPMVSKGDWCGEFKVSPWAKPFMGKRPDCTLCEKPIARDDGALVLTGTEDLRQWMHEGCYQKRFR